MLRYDGAYQSTETRPLIPLAPTANNNIRSIAVASEDVAKRGVVDELSELAGLSKRQLYWISIFGIVFKVVAAGLLYFAYKHRIGPFATVPESDAAVVAPSMEKPLY